MSEPARRGWAAEAGRFLRANFASLAASGLDYLVVTGLVLARVHYLLAAAAGALSGAVTDFALKRHWAFDRGQKGAVHHEAGRYAAVSGASLGLNLLGAWALVDGLGLPAVPGVIAASIVVGFAWNYPLHRWFVFRHAAPRPAEAAVAGEPARQGAGRGAP
jgi:putative flippase GtrA